MGNQKEELENLRASHDALKALHESANSVIDNLQRENQQIKMANTILTAEKTQWEQSKELQEQVIQQTLDRVNTLNNQYLLEIQELKDEVRELKKENKELRENR